ncbi:MAG: hypothetical protein F4Z18_10525 [Caldilineaceae bacterium SB0666_bin_21]|nr:hypothetical protein [Caldilineaceae bacterium SB0666_bin_21]
MSSGQRLDHPLRFVPHMRDAVWGGHRLAERLPWVPAGSRLAEAWLVSGHPTAETPVAHGPLAGRRLSRLIREFGTDLVGTRHADTVAQGRFPILLKLLDVDEWLSVQVHPAQGDGRHETFGKTEMWIVLAAEPDAELILGLKPGTTRADIQQAGPSRTLTHWLQRHQVRAGDTFFVPAGQVHALGPGITVLEVQETSNTTWRMYDWDRPLRPEQPRPLHWRQSLACLDTAVAVSNPVVPRPETWQGLDASRLITCPQFAADLATVAAGESVVAEGDPTTCRIMVVLEGSLGITAAGGSAELGLLDCCLLPAALESFTMTGLEHSRAAWVHLP